jgi:hypothetical protein
LAGISISPVSCVESFGDMTQLSLSQKSTAARESRAMKTLMEEEKTQEMHE